MAGTLDSRTWPALDNDLSVSAEVREPSGRPCTVVTLTGRADDAGRARLRAALHSYTRWGPGFVLIDLPRRPAHRPLPQGQEISSHRSGTGFKYRSDERRLDVIEEFVALAADAGVSLTHLAMAFAIAHPGVTAAPATSARPTDRGSQ